MLQMNLVSLHLCKGTMLQFAFFDRRRRDNVCCHFEGVYALVAREETSSSTLRLARFPCSVGAYPCVLKWQHAVVQV